ncbi:lysosome-associated membrane glycoprotein 1-like [Portunus trituberculatus]|uniref:lysosome-associated membrane glycoprotein 1-like n=1 Tax=Portunus trituberculatus TaxID=210409 RepID=UPI001E1CCDBF|nr:lysosome-associated membrane glycoprotein 1-like [Portunus trituberculatus]
MSATAAAFVCFAVVAVVAGTTDVLPALTRVPANTVTSANTTNTPGITQDSTTHSPSPPDSQPPPNAKKRTGAGASPQLTDEGAVDIPPRRHSPSGGDVGNTELLAASARIEDTNNKLEKDNVISDVVYEELPVPMALKGTDTSGYMRSDGTYIVNDDDGVSCVMFYFKANVNIYYPDTKGDYLNTKVYTPDNADVSGTCDRVGKMSEISISWGAFILSLAFGQDDITDTWFVSRFNLTYNLNDAKFPNAAQGIGQVSAVSKPGRKWWQTSNARSFRCLVVHDVRLTDATNHTAILHFDEVRVQAFNNEAIFRTPKHCKHRVHRDEMVPVTVGGVLAGSTLLTILVYGIFRYFKIKKVQYDIME